LGVVNNLVPTGGTPLTAAVEQAANVLDFRKKPGIIVLLTDGEETCGRSPCELGAQLHAEAKQLTIHVISLRVSGLSASMGEQTLLETKCLAEQNNGVHVPVDTEDDLIAALEKTLGCPLDLKAKVVGHRLNSSPLGEMQLLPKPWLGRCASPAMKPSLSPTT
jgi:Ca-activated chloride channel family protein